MRAVGRVVTIGDGDAEVEFDPASACGGCRGGCSVIRGRGHSRLRLNGRGGPDGLPLAQGQLVTLEVAEGALARSAARTFLPPVGGLIAGALIARVMSVEAEGIALLAAVLGGIAGHFAARFLSRQPVPCARIVAVEH